MGLSFIRLNCMKSTPIIHILEFEVQSLQQNLKYLEVLWRTPLFRKK